MITVDSLSTEIIQIRKDMASISPKLSLYKQLHQKVMKLEKDLRELKAKKP